MFRVQGGGHTAYSIQHTACSIQHTWYSIPRAALCARQQEKQRNYNAVCRIYAINTSTVHRWKKQVHPHPGRHDDNDDGDDDHAVTLLGDFHEIHLARGHKQYKQPTKNPSR